MDKLNKGGRGNWEVGEFLLRGKRFGRERDNNAATRKLVKKGMEGEKRHQTTKTFMAGPKTRPEGGTGNKGWARAKGIGGGGRKKMRGEGGDSPNEGTKKQQRR